MSTPTDKNISPSSVIPYRGHGGQPDRERDPWTRLSLYQSRDLLEERYKERHGVTPNDGKCREIASHLIQGGQYFALARNAGDLARPLLLYYGVLALTRALILFADRATREATLSEAHGLAAHEWSNLLVGEKAAVNIPQLHLQFRKGTFSELARASGNAEWTEVTWMSDMPRLGPSTGLSGEIGWLAAGTSELVADSIVTVGDILGRIPDLAFLYEETIDEPAACHPAEITVLRGPFNLGPNVQPKDHEIQIVVSMNRLDLLDDTTLMATLGLDSARFTSLGRDHFGRYRFVVKLSDTITGVDVLSSIRVNRHWANYLVAPLRDGLVLSSMSLLFLAAYATGMLVRYYPTTWQGMSSIRRGDRAFPLLRATVAHVERQFPIEVADFFERNIPIGIAEDLPRRG